MEDGRVADRMSRAAWRSCRGFWAWFAAFKAASASAFAPDLAAASDFLEGSVARRHDGTELQSSLMDIRAKLAGELVEPDATQGRAREVAMATITYAFDLILGETTLNQNTTGVQSLPAAADLAGGGYISAWDNQGNISGRIFENSGAARTAEFTINTTLTGIQNDPAVVGLVGGRAVVVWTDLGGVEAEVRAQIINSDGSLFGPEIIISEQPAPLSTAGAQTAPDVAALSDGGWVVTWQDNDAVGSNDVLAQIYNADGSFRSVPGGSDPGRIVIGGTDNDFLPTVAPITGGFAVIYAELVGATDRVRLQRYDLAGAPLGVEVLADNTGTTNRELDATGLANGGFAFVYTDSGQSAGAETDISLQVWTSAGVFTSLATANVNIPGFNAGLDGFQLVPAIDVMSNGFLTVSWTNAWRSDPYDL